MPPMATPHPPDPVPARKIILALGLMVLLAVGACASNQDLACRPDERIGVTETLYFGTAKTGGAVTRDEWNRFFHGTVTPLFPDGLTSWKPRASGGHRMVPSNARLRMCCKSPMPTAWKTIAPFKP